MLKWLTNFITTRSTRVQYKNNHSTFKQQNLGLPQGSALSAILYILYTINYKLTATGQKFLQKGDFADDTIIWNKTCKLTFYKENITKILEFEYKNFNNWCKKWKLVLNNKKKITTIFQKSIQQQTQPNKISISEACLHILPTEPDNPPPTNTNNNNNNKQ